MCSRPSTASISNRSGENHLSRREQPRPVPRIVGKIKRRIPAIVEDLKFAKAQTNKPIKMDVPGPMTVVDSTFDEFYKDEARHGDGRRRGDQ